MEQGEFVQIFESNTFPANLKDKADFLVNINGVDMNFLMYACSINKVVKVRQLVSISNCNLVNCLGQTALHIAVINNSFQSVLVLINDSDLNIQDKNGSSPIFYACIGDRYNIVSTLLLNDVNIHLTNNEDMTILMLCAKGNHLQLVKMLVKECSNELSQTDIENAKVHATPQVFDYLKAIKLKSRNNAVKSTVESTVELSEDLKSQVLELRKSLENYKKVVDAVNQKCSELEAQNKELIQSEKNKDALSDLKIPNKTGKESLRITLLKMKELYTELLKEYNNNDFNRTCQVCWNETKSHAVDCGHLYCEDCVLQVIQTGKCFYCQERVSISKKIYL